MDKGPSLARERNPRRDIRDLQPCTTLPHRTGRFHAASTQENLKSEPEDFSNNAENSPGGISPEELGEQVPRASTGQKSLHMKNMKTPRAEDTRGNEVSESDYFQAGPFTHNEDNSSKPSNISISDPCSRVGNTSRVPSSRDGSQEFRQTGFSALMRHGNGGLEGSPASARSILREGLDTSRRRASSGPSGMFDGLKKIWDDLQSLPAGGWPSFSNSNFGPSAKDGSPSQESTRPTSAGTSFGRRDAPSQSSPRRDHTQNPSETDGRLPHSGEEPHPARTDETGYRKVPSKEVSLSHGREHQTTPQFSILPLETRHGSLAPTASNNPIRLRRPTSDSALYLTKTTSRSSTLSKTDEFDKITEQINSRFKAIKDTFYDSQISHRRLPKMPSINFAGLRQPSKEKVKGEAMSQNMRFDDSSISGNAGPGSTSMKSSFRKTHRAHPLLSGALSSLTGDVVVLGGYRGSILRSAEPPHRQLWVPVKVGLNLRKVDLEVGLCSEDEERMEETILASGVLSHIGPVDICRRLLRHLNKCPNSRHGKLRVHDYGYDWRLSPHLSSRRLIKFLEGLECNQPGVPAKNRGATIIAHSLGGLITRHAVNRRPDLCSGIVYAGVPQHAVNILGPLRNGDNVLLSSRVLTAQVNFTFRTSFLLLPEDGKCFLNKQTSERYDVDFFDAKTWEEYHLSPCIKTPLPPVQQDHRKSLIDTFADNLPSLSLPSKLSSWSAGTRKSADPSSNKIEDPGKRITDKAGDAADAVAEAGYSATSPERNEIVPSMNQTYKNNSVATTCTIPVPEAMAYLNRTLAAVKMFKQELAFNPTHDAANVYPPCAFIYGNTVPTVYGARVASREAIRHSDAYSDLAFAAGDGVVLASSATLPKGYRCVKGGKVVSDRGHIGLLGDLEGIGRALAAVLEARVKGVGLGRDQSRPGAR